MMPVVLAKDGQEPKLVRPRDLSIYPEESKENKTWAKVLYTYIRFINILYNYEVILTTYLKTIWIAVRKKIIGNRH